MQRAASALLIALAAAGAPVRAGAPSPLSAIVLPPAIAPGSAVRPYVKVSASRVVLVHATLIDGTGGPAQRDRSIVIEGAKIVSVSPGDAPVPVGATVLDLTGRTVLPGLVGMHDHMYYIARPNLDAAGHSEPPLVVPR